MQNEKCYSVSEPGNNIPALRPLDLLTNLDVALASAARSPVATSIHAAAVGASEWWHAVLSGKNPSNVSSICLWFAAKGFRHVPHPAENWWIVGRITELLWTVRLVEGFPTFRWCLFRLVLVLFPHHFPVSFVAVCYCNRKDFWDPVNFSSLLEKGSFCPTQKFDRCCLRWFLETPRVVSNRNAIFFCWRVQ